MAELLPWLNLLLLPSVYGIVRIAVTLSSLEARLIAHDELDRVRFVEINRRIELLETQSRL